MELVRNLDGFRREISNETAGERTESQQHLLTLALHTEECAWKKGSLKPPMACIAPCSYNRNSSTLSHKHTLIVELREQGQRGEGQTLSSYVYGKIILIISFVCCLSLKLRETRGRCPFISPFPQLRGSFPSPLLCAWECFCVSPTTNAVEVPWNESDAMKKTKIISSEWPDSKRLLHS